MTSVKGLWHKVGEWSFFVKRFLWDAANIKRQFFPPKAVRSFWGIFSDNVQISRMSGGKYWRSFFETHENVSHWVRALLMSLYSRNTVPCFPYARKLSRFMFTRLRRKAHSSLNTAYSYTKKLYYLLKKDISQVSDVYFKLFSPVSIPVSSGRYIS